MSERGPDFDELVGTDLEAGERKRLQRVHELLVEAGPPPELPLPFTLRPQRRRGALVAIAAALAIAVFAVGVAVGGRSDEPGVDFVVAMSGTAAAVGAKRFAHDLRHRRRRQLADGVHRRMASSRQRADAPTSCG